MNGNGSIGQSSLSAAAVPELARFLAEKDGRRTPVSDLHRGSDGWLGARLRGWLGERVLGRVLEFFGFLCLGTGLLLAVFSNSGWLGIAIHWLAFFGVASLLEKTSSNPTRGLAEAESPEGDAPCATGQSETV